MGVNCRQLGQVTVDKRSVLTKGFEGEECVQPTL